MFNGDSSSRDALRDGKQATEKSNNIDKLIKMVNFKLGNKM